jgi:hypothetical protein
MLQLALPAPLGQQIAGAGFGMHAHASAARVLLELSLPTPVTSVKLEVNTSKLSTSHFFSKNKQMT